MSRILPPSQPAASRSLVESHARAHWASHRPGQPLPTLYLVGIPGYYWRTMGDPQANDRGLYDDALFILSPHTFAAFNASTDPSIHRPGIATLLPGVYPYRPGNHGITRPGGGYPAFRPGRTSDIPLPVRRDGEAKVPSARPGIAINIHRGGLRSTSSEGCQTIPPAQWPAFHALLTSELRRAGQRWFDYLLLPEGPIT